MNRGVHWDGDADVGRQERDVQLQLAHLVHLAHLAHLVHLVHLARLVRLAPGGVLGPAGGLHEGREVPVAVGGRRPAGGAGVGGGEGAVDLAGAVRAGLLAQLQGQLGALPETGAMLLCY